MKQVTTLLKNVGINELERTLDKCLAWLYAYPRARIGLTELSKKIKSSKTATKNVVNDLITQKFLKSEIAGRAWILSVNQKHPALLTKKMPYHLSKIYESDVLEAVYQIVQSPRSVILFGSYRWGTDTEESDIDIAAEVLGNEELKIVQLGIIRELGYRKDVKVNLHIFSRNKIDLNLFANIANGIVLDGFLEVRP